MPIHVVQHEYPDLACDVVPTVDGIDIILPPISPNVCGVSPDILGAIIHDRPFRRRNYTVYISPEGYCLTVMRPDAQLKTRLNLSPIQVRHIGSALSNCQATKQIWKWSIFMY